MYMGKSLDSHVHMGYYRFMRRFEPTRYEAIATQSFRILQAMHITFDTLLTSAIIGHTLFLVSYLSISLVIHAKRYSRKYVMAQANPGSGIKPQCDMELDIRIDELATRLERFNHQFVDPPTELGPECDGGLLAAQLQANAREVQAMAANIEQPEAVLTIPTAPTYEEMTRTQLLKLVQKQALSLPKGYIKKQTLIAILEGDLAQI